MRLDQQLKGILLALSVGPASRARGGHTPQMEGEPAVPHTASTTAATSRCVRSRGSWALYGWCRNSSAGLRTDPDQGQSEHLHI